MEKLSMAEFRNKGTNKGARGKNVTSLAELEASIRKVVREEMQTLLETKEPMPIPTQTHNYIEIASGASGTRNLELRFTGEFPKEIFTFNKLVAESESHVNGLKRKLKNDVAIQVALYDSRSGALVNEGRYSSTKVMLCVLSGDFGSKGMGDWSQKEFDDSVLPGREGKPPLIKGELFIDLKDGFADIRDVSFTDNSCWTATKKFKLGAKAVHSGGSIREAISESFRVKDLEGEGKLCN